MKELPRRPGDHIGPRGRPSPAFGGKLMLHFADVRLESGSEIAKTCPQGWTPPADD
jgi:hypothetical protein